jgi:hypothetical protein
MDRAAAGDNGADQLGDPGIPLEHAGEIGKRAQGQDRDLPRMRLDRLPDHLLRRMAAVQRHPRQLQAAEAVGAVDARRPRQQEWLRRGGAEPWQPGRVEKGDDGLGVGRRLVRGNVAGHRRDGEHLDAGIEQRECQGDGIVDPGIAVDDQLAGDNRGHGTDLLTGKK